MFCIQFSSIILLFSLHWALWLDYKWKVIFLFYKFPCHNLDISFLHVWNCRKDRRFTWKTCMQLHFSLEFIETHLILISLRSLLTRYVRRPKLFLVVLCFVSVGLFIQHSYYYSISNHIILICVTRCLNCIFQFSYKWTVPIFKLYCKI